MKILFVLLGPTAVGKTEVCLKIAQRLHAPIINADSRQIFEGIPIGTAAPTAEQLSTVRHYTRRLMKSRLEEEGLERLVEELRILDPEYYAIVDRKNIRRVVHALEICYMTGKTYTSFRTNEKKHRDFRIVKIGLNRDRNELYDRINQRVLQMVSQGLEDEVRRVYPYKGVNALNTVGYREMFDFIEGKCSREEAIEKIQSNTRRYCRKQLTWFKRDPDIHWFNPDDLDGIMQLIDKETASA